MRVLHVSEVSWGGVVSLIRPITMEQRKRGHQVALLSPQIMPPVVSVEYYPWSVRRDRPTTYPRAFRELRRAICDFQPDVVHLHSFVAGLMGRLPLATGSAAIAYQPHAWSLELIEDKRFRNSLAAWERMGSRRTKVLVTNCQDEIDEGHSIGVLTAGRAIGVTVDIERFCPVDNATKQRRRQELGLYAKNVLLCIGRLARQKGQDLLVAAWEQAPPPNTELVLLGPGDVNALRALAPTEWGRSIRAVGEHVDVRPWIWASDALVLSSRYETVAVVVAEALACGRPVVATDVNGAREVIQGGDLPAGGHVVPVGDMASLLAAARQLLDRPREAAEMSLAGRARAERFFTAEAVVDRLDAAYRVALSTPEFDASVSPTSGVN